MRTITDFIHGRQNVVRLSIVWGFVIYGLWAPLFFQRIFDDMAMIYVFHPPLFLMLGWGANALLKDFDENFRQFVPLATGFAACLLSTVVGSLGLLVSRSGFVTSLGLMFLPVVLAVFAAVGFIAGWVAGRILFLIRRSGI